MSLPDEAQMKAGPVFEHRQQIGRVNNVDAMYERKFLLERLQPLTTSPADVPRLIRELMKGGYIAGPYTTSRKKKSIQVLHLNYEKLHELEERMDEEVNGS